jgi:transcriptional regulator with XRE-family HTH domain
MPDVIEEIALTVSTNIKTLRVKKNLTQAQLAHEAGVTQETVARIERAVRHRPSANANPSLETLTRLATVLGVKPSRLLVA